MLICQKCSEGYSLNDARWRCDCGGLLDVHFESRLPIEKIVTRRPNMWRYREALPIESDEHIISYDEGFTPLIKLQLQGREILVKQDHLFQTGSYKDRGASLLISKANELRIHQVVEDSSGNAGCAIAAYCAKAGIECEILVPASISRSKLVQIEMYGAKLRKIPGSREDTAAATLQTANSVYYASHSWNPFFFQGTKTFAFEVCEQLGWLAPDIVLLPVGNGTLLIGAYIGFVELQKVGIISNLPRLIGVQAANCAPLADAFDKGHETASDITPVKTFAEGIAIARPVRGRQILECVRASHGMIMTVTDAEIRAAVLQMAKLGIFIEPTSGATIAAVNNYAESSAAKETIVTLVTGHGLKTADKWH